MKHNSEPSTRLPADASAGESLAPSPRRVGSGFLAGGEFDAIEEPEGRLAHLPASRVG